jgi:hypothetical protein
MIIANNWGVCTVYVSMRAIMLDQLCKPELSGVNYSFPSGNLIVSEDSSCSGGPNLLPNGLLRGTGGIYKPDAGGKPHLDPLGFALADGDVDIVRVAQFLFLTALLALEEPGFGMLDACHRLHDIHADYSPKILNHSLVVEKGLGVDGKLVTQLFE